MTAFSDYIVYVDESGDHGLVKIDPTYPVFVLAFCIFEKTDYANTVAPGLQQLKFKWFGHDIVVLHEHEIRKSIGPFKFLLKETNRTAFLQDVTALMESVQFTLIATVVRKDLLTARYTRPYDPYTIGMQFCLERLHKFLEARNEENKTTYVVAEQRGRNEDNALELEFRRICGGNNYRSERFPFELALAPKTVNSCGLQIADLVARPIGLHVLRPEQPNQAYVTIEKKLDRAGGFWPQGRGLKVFP